MQQILTNTANTLEVTFYVDGTATDADGNVTYSAVDGSGTAVTSGTATLAGVGTGTYQFTLAPQSAPNVLTVTWSGTFSAVSHSVETTAEVVGGFLFTEAQARSYDASALSNTGTYPDDDITDGRVQITESLEQWTGRSWVPRYCRAEFSGSGMRNLWLGDGRERLADGTFLHRPGRLIDVSEVLSATVDGVSVNTANIVIKDEMLWRTDEAWNAGSYDDPLNVVVEWVYGHPALVDGVDRIGLMLLRDRLVASAIDDRAVSISNEIGTMRLVAAGGPMRNASRLPEVNEWVRNHAQYRMGF